MPPTRLAAGLSSGDLDKVDFTDSASRASTSYAQITDGIGKAKVSVGKVSTDGDHGTATLKWSRHGRAEDLVLRDRGDAAQG